MPSKIRERDIEQKVVRYCKSIGALIYKFSSPSHRGVCDRIIVLKGGQVIFLELKAPKQKPTALQAKFLKDIIAQGGKAVWADSFELAKQHIDGGLSYDDFVRKLLA